MLVGRSAGAPKAFRPETKKEKPFSTLDTQRVLFNLVCLVEASWPPASGCHRKAAGGWHPEQL